MIAIKIAHMHSPTFMGGNLGKDIDVSRFTGMKIWHDLERGLLFILYKGKSGVAQTWDFLEPFEVADYGLTTVGLAVVPPVNVHHNLKVPAEIAAIAQVENPTTNPGKRGRPAQVQTPMDHVHAGLGAGKTRD